jgi:hypothetical protein
LFAAGGLWAQTRARKFELALVYIQQYWAVDKDLIQESRPATDSASVQRYLRLGEDEFDAARQGCIDVSIWRIWHDGMRMQVRDDNLDPAEFKQLKLCMKEETDHEATKCPGLGKTGLRRKMSWWFERLLGG